MGTLPGSAVCRIVTGRHDAVMAMEHDDVMNDEWYLHARAEVGHG